MRNIEEFRSTTNRTVFNRSYKLYLEQKGKIHCSFCKYHKGDNFNHKAYGGYVDKIINYPNWKLVSKERKQWMGKKNMKIKVSDENWRKVDYVEIII